VVKWAGDGCWAEKELWACCGKKEKGMGGLLGWKDEGIEVWFWLVFFFSFSFSTLYSKIFLSFQKLF
jgi:hypothetical protein